MGGWGGGKGNIAVISRRVIMGRNVRKTGPLGKYLLVVVHVCRVLSTLDVSRQSLDNSVVLHLFFFFLENSIVYYSHDILQPNVLAWFLMAAQKT